MSGIYGAHFENHWFALFRLSAELSFNPYPAKAENMVSY